MRFDVTKWTRLAALGLVSGAFLLTGCSSSSGWKMPGSKMFSWSKKPSETTLAGSGPSSIKFPESPSSKQNPQAIASAAAGTSSSKSALGGSGATSLAANGTGARSTQPVYTPPNGMANVAFAPPGAAAAANGYSVGPYNTYSQPGGAANSLASSGAPSGFGGVAPATGMSPSNPFNTASKSGFPTTQAYAGSPPNALAANRGMQAPASFQPNANQAFPGSPQPTIPGMGGANIPNSFAAASSSPPPSFGAAPIQTGTPGFAVPQTMPTTGGYTPVGTSGMAPSTPGSFASAPAGAFPGSMPTSGLPTIPGAQPPAGMSGVPAQMAAYNNGSSAVAPSTASFRPGSTGRQTNYNFSQPSQPSTFVNQTPPTFGVPAAKEANGLNDPGYNPGFQIPPTGTTFR